MIGPLLDIVIDERYWLTAALALGTAVVLVYMGSLRGSGLAVERRVLPAMNLAAGVVLGTMASGHLLAVAVARSREAVGRGSLPVLIGIGLALLVPALLIVGHTKHLASDGRAHPHRTTVLHGWLAATLLVLGLHNLPLASLSLLTIAYRGCAGTRLGWVIAGMAFVLVLGLFSASLVFVASGQTFEQFRQLE